MEQPMERLLAGGRLQVEDDAALAAIDGVETGAVGPARAGHAPQRLGVLSPRGVPLQALLLSSTGIAIAAILSVVAAQSAFTLMIAISSFGAMFTWLMIFITHYCFRRARARIRV